MEEVKLTSTITCPQCSHQKTEEMPQVPASFFMPVKLVEPCLNPKRATAVYIAPLAQYLARPCKQVGINHVVKLRRPLNTLLGITFAEDLRPMRFLIF